MWVAMLTIAKDVYCLPLSFMPDCLETEFLSEALSGRLGGKRAPGIHLHVQVLPSVGVTGKCSHT